ncbi:MAG: enoyl-CoA hydratase/isomerase family protein [Pseudomonadota bacterium]|nr:enoyl-CoA hydratase/isomerase family protein [Pseudomonadota bacterium]
MSEKDTDGAVHWREQAGVGHIVLDRPQGANALSMAMGRQLAQAVAQAARADVGAVLLSAQGGQFCAGGDIREFVAQRERLNVLVHEMLDVLHPAMHTLATLPLPVVSAVQGPVGGAGIALALCADVVLASSAMFLRGGYSAIGLSPDLGASYFLARRGAAVRRAPSTC